MGRCVTCGCCVCYYGVVFILDGIVGILVLCLMVAIVIMFGFARCFGECWLLYFTCLRVAMSRCNMWVWTMFVFDC